MSLLDISAFSDRDYARSFDDVDRDSSLGLPEPFQTPKLMGIQTDSTFDPADPDFFSGISSEWGRPSQDQLLGSPITVSEWVLAEEAFDSYSPITPEEPALTRPQTQAPAAHHPHAPRDEVPVARVALPRLEDAPLESDDDYDYAAEIVEEQASFLARAAVAASTSAHASPLSAPSPPLSSEAPSPESVRDFDSFSDDVSGSSWSGRVRSESPVEWAPDPVFHAQNDAYYASDGVNAVEEGAYHDLESVTDDDAEGEGEDDESAQIQDAERPTNDAMAPTQPLPRLAISLPARYRVTAPSPPAQFEDESEADASYADDSDDDSDFEVPLRKHRRTNSGKATAVPVAPLPKRPAAKGKGKAPAKTPAPKSKCGPSEQLLVPADAPRPKLTKNAAGKFLCPLRDLGCTQRPLKENGMQRHYSEHHVQKERLLCPTGCGKTFSRMDVLRKHLGGERIAATCKAPKEKVAACLQTLNAKKRKRSS